MSNAKLIEVKRSQARSLMDKYMVSNSVSSKNKIREDIHSLWDEVRLLLMEDTIESKIKNNKL
jgi:hypothetical protein